MSIKKEIALITIIGILLFLIITSAILQIRILQKRKTQYEMIKRYYKDFSFDYNRVMSQSINNLKGN
nr:MAG TPA: Ribosome associated membrane protein RAMP4 [Caudoviricetes sp.]